MTYEVELKFPLVYEGVACNVATLLAQLGQLGAERGSVVKQRDVYFAHPNRDFAETDEAFRLRTTGSQNCITYKGPIVDKQAKTRHEIEIPLGDGSQNAQQFGEMLELLSFHPAGTVAKQRTLFRLPWEDRTIEVVLDEVDGLGTFLEMEILAEEAARAAARDCLLRLAAHLGLENSIRQSYLCMLLRKPTT